MEREVKLLLQRSVTFKELHIYYFDSLVIDLLTIPSALSSAQSISIFLFILHVSLLFTLHACIMIVEVEVF